jgi:ABC-type transport system involved in cytochrome bd biosynthesis fused ATPase/permease subunit
MIIDNNKSPYPFMTAISRIALMFIFAFILYVIALFYSLILSFQIFYILFVETPHTRTLKITQRLNSYIKSVIDYMTFNSDKKPYPFARADKDKNP